jgi:hypothetical protein
VRPNRFVGAYDAGRMIKSQDRSQSSASRDHLGRRLIELPRQQVHGTALLRRLRHQCTTIRINGPSLRELPR